MPGIRPLQDADLDAVASLYERVARSGSDTPAPGLAAYLGRTLLGHPWVDPELPSLVYDDGAGGIGGFIGSHVRRFTFDGEPVRLVCAGPLVSDPSVRQRGVGALLLRRLLAGPQDVTITDGATPEVREMWERLGGATRSDACIGWICPIAPGRFAAGAVANRLGRPLIGRVLAPVAAVADRGARRLGLVRRAAASSSRSEPLTPAAVLEHLPALDRVRLRPAYDEPFLVWLFAEMARVAAWGDLAPRLVRNAEGAAIGWYVAYRGGDRRWRVMQIAAARGETAAVVRHLLHDAEADGAVAVAGRADAAVFEAVAAERALFTATDRALVHSTGRPEIVDAVLRGDALLSRLDGEWWMGPHLL